jgi:hypothetical protein
MVSGLLMVSPFKGEVMDKAIGVTVTVTLAIVAFAGACDRRKVELYDR